MVSSGTPGASRHVALVRLIALMGAIAVCLSLSPLAAHAADRTGVAAAGPIEVLKVVGSPFYPDGDGVRDRVKFVVRLSGAATLALEVRDFDGRRVRTIVAAGPRSAGRYVFYWKGRDSAGVRVADGPYVLRATAQTSAGTWTAKVPFTKAPKPIFGERPGAIVVAIDPGHGDVYSDGGRTAPDGSHEKQYNLDIGLRLQKMLEGAGVGTVISRTTDQGANTPEWDRNEDGAIDYADELAARCDMA